MNFQLRNIERKQFKCADEIAGLGRCPDWRRCPLCGDCCFRVGGILGHILIDHLPERTTRTSRLDGDIELSSSGDLRQCLCGKKFSTRSNGSRRLFYQHVGNTVDGALAHFLPFMVNEAISST